MKLLKKIAAFMPHKLFAKIMLLYSLLIVLILCTVYLLFYNYTKTGLINRAVSSTFTTLEQTQHNIENNLKQVEQLTAIIFSDTNAQKFLNSYYKLDRSTQVDLESTVNKLLVDIKFSHSDIESVSLYDSKGNYIGVNPLDRISNFQPFYDLAAEYKGKLRWIFSPPEESGLWAARVVYNYNIEPVGLMLVKYKETGLRKIITSRLNGSNGTIYILDKAGNVISCPNASYLNTVFPAELPQKNSTGLYTTTQLYGETCYTTVFPSSYNEWQYVGVIPKASVDMDFFSLFFSVTIISICVGIFAIFAAFLIAKRVTNPINKLTDHMKEVDLNMEPGVSYPGSDEIAYLYAAYNDMQERIRQLIADNYEQKLLQNEIEIKILHMQINPHFLYNTLDSVYCMALESGNHTICQIIKSLADMLRYSIAGNGEQLSTIRAELKHVEDYCIIQKLRMGDALEYYIDVDESIYDIPIPKLTLEPFVENSINHANQIHLQGILEIGIVGFAQENTVVIQISDNGGGLTPETLEKLKSRIDTVNFSEIHGIALPNVNGRIRRLFGKDYGISIIPKNDDGGATFQISLPLNFKKKPRP